MACDDHEEVDRVGELLISFIHGRAESFPVDGHTAAIAAIVGIFHSVFLSKLVVPGVFHRFAVVSYITVAENSHMFPGQGSDWAKRREQEAIASSVSIRFRMMIGF